MIHLNKTNSFFSYLDEKNLGFHRNRKFKHTTRQEKVSQTRTRPSLGQEIHASMGQQSKNFGQKIECIDQNVDLGDFRQKQTTNKEYHLSQDTNVNPQSYNWGQGTDCSDKMLILVN